MASTFKEEEKEGGLDPRCRIVVVSSSLQAGRAFVDSVIALSNPTATDTSSLATPKKDKTPDDKDEDRNDEPIIIPYTLTNRYYTADVHFAVYTCAEFVKELGSASSAASERDEDGDDDAEIPVFKSEFASGGLDVGFKRGFEEGFEEEEGAAAGIKHAPGVVYVWVDGEGYKKEVGEVVGGMRRAGYEPEVCLAVRVPGAGGGAEEEDVDGAFMEYGFEYVDARDESDGDEDVGRLPRVVDALSTVMWVSMRSKAKDEERDGIMRELMDVVVSKAEDSTYVASPVDMDMLAPFGRVGGLGRKVSMGFEDEFEPRVGDGLGEYMELSEGEPTQAEIEETAGRIFGGDLSDVLLSLQSLKGEIANMENDEERKKMAARVALGLAYGLDIE